MTPSESLTFDSVGFDHPADIRGIVDELFGSFRDWNPAFLGFCWWYPDEPRPVREFSGFSFETHLSVSIRDDER
jgi:hypothetical protein